MSEEIHVFKLKSVWNGNTDGSGELILDDQRTVTYGVPVNLGGNPGRSNPEELLTSAVAGCYSITLALLAEKKRLPLIRIEMDAEGEVIRQPDRSLKFRAIRLFPKLTLSLCDEATQKTALDIAFKAEKLCMISTALRPNVEITVFPELTATES